MQGDDFFLVCNRHSGKAVTRKMVLNVNRYENVGSNFAVSLSVAALKLLELLNLHH